MYCRESPPRKRQKMDTTKKEKENSISEDSFSIKSFYGKREKKQFPHSPKRRKAVYKVLEKISDENTDSDSDMLKRKQPVGRKTKENMFEFHSSASGESDTDPGNLYNTRQANTKLTANKKVPLKVKQTQKTPKPSGQASKRVQSYSTGKLPDRVEKLKDDEVKLPNSDKKFFKTRSPKDTYKSVKSLFIVKRGFDMKFIPRKSGDKSPRKQSKNTNKTKPVDKAKASSVSHFKNVAAEMAVTGSEIAKDSQVVLLTKPDGTVSKDTSVNTRETVPYKEDNCVVADAMKSKEDSGLESGNSNDLFSSCQNVQTEVAVENTNDEDEYLSLISADSHAGSEDLFSVTSDCNTPVADSQISSTTDNSSKSGTPNDTIVSDSLKESPLSGSSEVSTPKTYPLFNSKPSTPSPPSSQLQKLR